MLTRAQKILIKRAQKEAGLDDADYRDALEVVCGCRSSTDPRVGDRDVDKLLAYFEAIIWREVDSGRMQPPCNRGAVFLQRGYWAAKNPAGDTSRDRHIRASIEPAIAKLEQGLEQLGYSRAYCDAIRAKVTNGRTDSRSLFLYKSALERTLASKQQAFSSDRGPVAV
jgi:hypothetical protein